MNTKEYKDFFVALLKLRKKYKYLNDITKNLTNNIEKLEEKCSHDLILVYADRKTKYVSYKEATCLLCDKTFYIETKKVINENIIDLTNHIPNCTWNSYIDSKSELVIEAQKILYKVLSYNDNIEKDDLKEVIVRNLIEFYFKRTKEVKKY